MTNCKRRRKACTNRWNCLRERNTVLCYDANLNLRKLCANETIVYAKLLC